jgi:restriction endonuclease S subunit
MMSVFTEIFNLFGTGTTFKEISADNFANFSLPFPDITEQHQIVSYLDQKCTEIDAVIVKTKATIEEYKKLKQSIITEAVTKGIRGDRPMKDSGIEWIGNIPTHWQVVPHKYVMHKEKTICEHYGGEDIISLTMNGVIVRDLSAGGKMPTTFDGYQYVEPEDLLLCLFDIDVTPRCVGIVRNYGVTSPAYSRFKVHEGYHNAYYDYLLRFIDDEKVFIHLSKNLRSSLTETDFGTIKTIVPPLYEQKEIADYLSKKCAEMDTLIARKTALLAEMEAYKKSVIYEYVTGKKEVQ